MEKLNEILNLIETYKFKIVGVDDFFNSRTYFARVSKRSIISFTFVRTLLGREYIYMDLNGINGDIKKSYKISNKDYSWERVYNAFRIVINEYERI